MIRQNRSFFRYIGASVPTGIRPEAGRKMTLKKSGTRYSLWVLVGLALCVCLLFADSAWHLSTETYSLCFDTLPNGFDGLRIVQLSDLHECFYGKDNRRLVQKVREAEPDLIAVTGDLVDETGQTDYVRTLMTQLTDIAPVYYVSGNHEWAAHAMTGVLYTLEDCGVTVLDDRCVRLSRNGDTITLAGLCDPNGPANRRTDKERVASFREEYGEQFTLLLAHRNRVEEYGALGPELTLCGHAHGGLIRLPGTDGLIGPSRDWFPHWTDGVYTPENTVLVSRGLSNRFPFVRFLNRPHIPLVILSCS